MKKSKRRMSESPKERKVKKRAWSTYNFKAGFALLVEDQNGLEPKKDDPECTSKAYRTKTKGRGSCDAQSYSRKYELSFFFFF